MTTHGHGRSILPAAAILIVCAAVSDGQVTFKEFPLTSVGIPGIGTEPWSITSGPDGNLWFYEVGGSAIGRITTSGVVTEFPLPAKGSSSLGRFKWITTGPDGNLWFTENLRSKVGRITSAGVITEFDIPSGKFSITITSGPDGNLWFTEAFFSGPPGIGRITTSGVVTEFASIAFPMSIAGGPDGNVWFTEIDRIGRITPAGTITEFPIPSVAPGSYGENTITTGPDGNLWFTMPGYIGRITPAGAITQFPAGFFSMPADITSGPDGNLWFTDTNGAGRIGRITTSGVVTGFPIVTAGSAPAGLAFGPDGKLWFTELSGTIVQMTLPPGSVAVPTLPVCGIAILGTLLLVTAIRAMRPGPRGDTSPGTR